MTCDDIYKAFDKRYHNTTTIIRIIRRLKPLNLWQLRDDEATDDDAFKNVLTDIERISSFAH